MAGAVVVAAVALAGCSGDDDLTPATSAPAGTETSTETATETTTSEADRFPDIVDVAPTYDESSGTWRFAVTVSSPYDTPERYADGWRVLGPGGTVYGVHTLTHDHAGEQPFTRTQTGVEIPADVTTVTIEGRDLVNGFGGTTLTIDL